MKTSGKYNFSERFVESQEKIRTKKVFWFRYSKQISQKSAVIAESTKTKNIIWWVHFNFISTKCYRTLPIDIVIYTETTYTLYTALYNIVFSRQQYFILSSTFKCNRSKIDQLTMSIQKNRIYPMAIITGLVFSLRDKYWNVKLVWPTIPKQEICKTYWCFSTTFFFCLFLNKHRKLTESICVFGGSVRSICTREKNNSAHEFNVN